ncbi:MAG: hypothetical protein PHR64_01405 [Candidatus Shapirobacteria bacterium]|nr:hypothetical protein [Candidatus Shapirobacteria bacterium]MDD5481590.1 hypothetical protein [Candidatus Shapirobacteria bacterium]
MPEGNIVDTIVDRMGQSVKKTKPALSQTPLPTRDNPDSWEKIKLLIEQEEAKENLIGFQEEVEDVLLESIDLNWPNMDNTEKKLAIRLGCLVKDLKKGLKTALDRSQH